MNAGILTTARQFATLPRGLLGRPSPVPTIDARRVFDPDAERYITAVERADQQPLEEGVRIAIGDFVIGCKEDDTWSALRTSCILMGARTLSGALTPLTGAAPTNNNFVSGDYARRTGLKGDGNTKWLGTGVLPSDFPQNDHSFGVFQASDGQSSVAALMGGGGVFNGNGFTQLVVITATGCAYRNRNDDTTDVLYSTTTPALTGSSRSTGASHTVFNNGSSATRVQASTTPNSSFTIDIFRRSSGNYASSRIGFYWIGTAINMARLEARVKAMQSAIQATV